MPRAVVRLSLACNNRCVFCAQAGLDGPVAPLEAQLAEARVRASDVTFVGGEPTLDEGLVAAVAAARAAGFARIGVQSNARALAERSRVAALAAAGLTDLQVSIHGSDAAVHDYHTGVDGTFAAALAGVAHARAYGVIVVAATVLTRSNFRVLSGLPLLLKSRDVAAWLVEVPHAAGRAGSAFDRVVPRLGLAVPFALHALEAAAAVSLPAWIRGVPLCLTGPHAGRVLQSEPRSYGDACADCAARPACAGVDGPYLARFAADELRPRAAVVPHAGPDSDLAALFVGPGPLVASSLGAVPPAPSHARASLPLIGRVQPARQEVSAATAKRTGAALREIFPDLLAGRKE